MKTLIGFVIFCSLSPIIARADKLLERPFTKDNYDAFTKKHGLADERVALLLYLVLERGFEAMQKGVDKTKIEKYVYKSGWTLRDALDQARKKKAAKAAEAETKKKKRMAKRTAILKQLKTAVSVKILAESISTQDGDELQVFVVEVANESHKEIVGVEGRFLVKDVFGKAFVQLPIRVVKRIGPRQNYTYKRKRPFDRTSRSQTKLHDEFDSLDLIWEPKSIAFSDGTVIKLAEKE